MKARPKQKHVKQCKLPNLKDAKTNEQKHNNIPNFLESLLSQNRVMYHGTNLHKLAIYTLYQDVYPT